MSDDEVSLGDTSSVDATSLAGSNTNSVGTSRQQHPYRNRNSLDTRNRLFSEMANKLIPPEDLAMMLKKLEKGNTLHVQRTYLKGIAMDEVQKESVFLRVGLTFLSGANRPEVVRLE